MIKGVRHGKHHPEVFRIPDYMDKLEKSGATWSHRSVKGKDGEWCVQIYNILTADEVSDMDLESVELEQLRALLPFIKELYENVECTLSEYDEYDEESDIVTALETCHRTAQAICRRIDQQRVTAGEWIRGQE